VDGVEVCRQIKADPKSQTAIIAISGQTDSADRVIKAGADAFLSKPLDLEALLAQIKKLLQVM
jgi:DNA-binding response OmpR family regulator